MNGKDREREETREKSVHPCMLRSKKQMNMRAFVLRFATEHYTEDKWQKIKVFFNCTKLIENYLNKFYCATLKGVFVD